MRILYAAAVAMLAGSAAGSAASAAWAQAQAQAPAETPMPQSSMSQGSMPLDTPTTIGGVDTVCTGIGQEAQNDPRWLGYPVRIEFSNGGAQYLSGAHVDLSTAGGRQLVSANCPGAWVLFRLTAGTYKVSAMLTGQPGGTSSATFSPPRSGQKRIVLDFAVKPNQ
jgi:opacity protein-like surface antigen